MNMKNASLVFLICCAVVVTSCRQPAPTSSSEGSNPVAPGQPQALPENGFKATITLVDPPTKLRAGEKQTIRVKVKNASDVMWYARGAEFNPSIDNKFYLAAGNRWLQADDETLITDMDGRYGLNKDLKPGEETEVPLVVTAPKEPGEYLLEVDAVQEQVAWFRDKGSPTARTKITVVR
ncbi:MAG TPA: hypothetical protein VNO50_16325 [Pyrinomonadaceae bacterium]|nr:hypothetical protein [Pyrinomonadaceae bacterium]